MRKAIGLVAHDNRKEDLLGWVESTYDNYLLFPELIIPKCLNSDYKNKCLDFTSRSYEQYGNKINVYDLLKNNINIADIYNNLSNHFNNNKKQLLVNIKDYFDIDSDFLNEQGVLGLEAAPMINSTSIYGILTLPKASLIRCIGPGK